MAGLCVALVKDLRRDPLMLRAELGNQLMEQAVIAGVAEHGHEDFAIVLEPNEDSDSARARRRRHGHRRVLPCRTRCRRCVVGRTGTAPGVTPRAGTRRPPPGPRATVAAFVPIRAPGRTSGRTARRSDDAVAGEAVGPARQGVAGAGALRRAGGWGVLALERRPGGLLRTDLLPLVTVGAVVAPGAQSRRPRREPR